MIIARRNVLRSLLASLLLSVATFWSIAAEAQLKVVTTLPDIAEIVRRVGGDQVKVESLLTGREDPHFIDAVPEFIRKTSNADIVCTMGLDLELGWMPKVLARSGNAKVQSGGMGFCEVGRTVHVLDKPSGAVDRSMGDVHPGGNPHFNLSPKALAEAAQTVRDVLVANKPDQTAAFDAGLARFKADMNELQKKTAEKLKGAIELSKKQPVVIEYHKQFSYFFDLYGLKSQGSIEEKPGVPPSAARTATVATAAKQAGVKLAIAASYSPERTMARFHEIAQIPYKQVPAAVQTSGEPDSIEKLQNVLAEAIANAVNAKP